MLIYRAFSTFLLGHLLLESSTVDLMDESVDEDIEFFESNRLSDYPRVQALGPQLSEDGYANEFEDSLEDLINRIQAFTE